MPHRNTLPVPVQQVAGGGDALVYPGKDGSVFIEMLRPDGARDGRNIAQYDPAILVSAILTATAQGTTPMLRQLQELLA